MINESGNCYLINSFPVLLTMLRDEYLKESTKKEAKEKIELMQTINVFSTELSLPVNEYTTPQNSVGTPEDFFNYWKNTYIKDDILSIIAIQHEDDVFEIPKTKYIICSYMIAYDELHVYYYSRKTNKVFKKYYTLLAAIIAAGPTGGHFSSEVYFINGYCNCYDDKTFERKKIEDVEKLYALELYVTPNVL